MAFHSGNASFALSGNGALAQTFYKVYGDLHASKQAPLVVGHGGGGTHHYLSSLSRLTESHDIPVILYDQLGFGLSSHFPDQAGNESFWTVDLLVDQLHHLIRHLGIERQYDFMGHSFGTVLGIGLSSSETLRMGMRRQILWSPAASVQLLDEVLKLRREMLPEDLRETLARHEADGSTDSEEYKAAHTASLHYDFCRLDKWPDELRESLSYSSEDGDAAMALFGNTPLQTTGSIRDWSALVTAKDIPVPTLLLNGRYDWSDKATEPLFWGIPSARWVTFSNSSHLLLLEEPERFLSMVSTWLMKD